MRRDISRFVEAARSVGLAEIVEPAAELLRRADGLKAELIEYRAKGDGAFSAAVAEIARNGLSAKALAEVRLRDSIRNPSSLSNAVDRARLLLEQQAGEACRPRTDELFVGLCAVVHDALGAIEALAIPTTVIDDQSAWKAGVDLKAVATLGEHVSRFVNAHHVYAYMRRFGWMPELTLAPLSVTLSTAEWAMFARPDRAWPDAVTTAHKVVPSVRLDQQSVWFLRLRHFGARPGMYTLGEFRQSFVDMVVERRVENKESAGPRTWGKMLAAYRDAAEQGVQYNVFAA